MRYMSTAFSCHATETPGRKGHSLMAPDGNRGSFQVAPVTRQSSWYLDIFGIPPTSPNMQCSYMILHVRMTKWCQKITWFAPIRSEMLTPMLAVANSICRPWAAPHGAQWSRSPAETPVTAGALPHFGVCIWVMSGNSMIDRMMYMFVLGVRSYKRVWRILEDGDP